MPVSLIPSFLFFCSVTCSTPGPANLCSLAAAMRYGRRQALIQWRGLFTGFAVISIISVLLTYFLGTVIGPYIRYLSFIGAAYILWLAFRILRSDPEAENEKEAAQNCGFLTGLLIQFTNVKVMVFCLTALASYVLPYRSDLASLLLTGILLPFISGPPWNLVWLFAGAALRDFFIRHTRPLNIAMALALAACAVSLVWPR